MAAKPRGFQQQKRTTSLLVNGVLILICVVWIIPALGVLITSFRPPEDIFASGWWTVFPHQAYTKVGEIKLDDAVDTEAPMQVEGVTATFEELRNGVLLPDGRKLVWYGNRRTRTVEIFSQQWQGFNTDLTLENYQNVLTGKEIRKVKPEDIGNNTTRRGFCGIEADDGTDEIHPALTFWEFS